MHDALLSCMSASKEANKAFWDVVSILYKRVRTSKLPFQLIQRGRVNFSGRLTERNGIIMFPNVVTLCDVVVKP